MMMMMTKLRMMMRGKGGMCVCGWMRSINNMAGRVRVGTDGERSGCEWSVLKCRDKLLCLLFAGAFWFNGTTMQRTYPLARSPAPPSLLRSK